MFYNLQLLLKTAFQPHFTTADHFLTALQVANISIPLTPKFLKMKGADGWMNCGHRSFRRRQEHLENLQLSNQPAATLTVGDLSGLMMHDK